MLLAVGASVGFLSLFGVEGSLIILEVVPFLVLAVGVDNLFILVHSYEVSPLVAVVVVVIIVVVVIL